MQVRELTDDEVVQRGHMALGLLNDQAVQLIINELIAESVASLFDTDPKEFKTREDHYHMVRGLREAILKAQSWANAGAAVLAARNVDKE